MNKENVPVDQIRMGLVIVLLVTLTGCAGLWGGGYYSEGYYGEEVIRAGARHVYFWR